MSPDIMQEPRDKLCKEKKLYSLKYLLFTSGSKMIIPTEKGRKNINNFLCLVHVMK